MVFDQAVHTKCTVSQEQSQEATKISKETVLVIDAIVFTNLNLGGQCVEKEANRVFLLFISVDSIKQVAL